MKDTFVIGLLLMTIGFTNVVQAQKNISATIFDKETNTPIPYATIKYGEFKGVITNDEGLFKISDKLQATDSLYITSIGYAQKNIAVAQIKDTLFLAPKEIELASVFLSTKVYTVDEIIEKVKENLATNYQSGFVKHRFFVRKSNTQYMKQFKFDFLKCSIKEISKKLLDSMVNLVPKKSSYYAEILGDYYYKPDTENTKLSMLKACNLYDENNDASAEALQKRFTSILNKNIKKDSYLKIKSGWFGTKVQVDSILPDPEKKKVDSLKNALKSQKNKQKGMFIYTKKRMQQTLDNLIFNEDAKVNVLEKENRYEFTLNGVVEFQDNLAYVIDYKPKRGEDYKGTLYINTQDFAVLRIDYKNSKKVYNGIFNMLGININHLVYKGTAVFAKENTKNYHLKYLSHTNIISSRINRPLTIIEKNKHVKGRRKQNELKLDMHINLITKDKREMVILQTEDVNGIDSVKENSEFEIKHFSSYNADYWKGYNIIEPNQAIKEFKAVAPVAN